MSRSRRRRQKLPTEPVSLTIERLAHDGRGIASIDGKLAFVRGALPGEEVRAICTSRRSSYEEYALSELLSHSPDRVVPQCSKADICGGCSLQHLSAEKQLAHKQQFLLDQLRHSAGLEAFEVLPPIVDRRYGYRRKARLAVRYVHKKEDVLVGFRESNGSFIVDMQECPILSPKVSALIAPLRQMLNQLEGKRDIPQIEVAVGELPAQAEREEIDPELEQVALIVRHMEALSEPDAAAILAFAQQHQLELYLQPQGPDSIHKVWPEDGQQRLYYHVEGLKMAFHPADFTQVNAGINRQMIAAALSLLDLQDDDVVLDLFCGLGNFTLPLARRCARVVGVEGSQQMVERGSENARLNGLDNVSFYAADLTTDFDQQTWGQPVYSKILLDPPRSGALEIIPKIAEFKAGKIVYISCNPATLARDAAELLKQGYVLRKAGILDMFPHTSHVESIAEFVLEKGKAKPSRRSLF